MDSDQEAPPLLDAGDTASLLSSFHESSTNVSIADSAAATLGSESFRDFSDRGQNSSNSSSSESVDSCEEEDYDVESGSNSNKPLPPKDGFNESEMSSDEDWVEENNGIGDMHNIKLVPYTDKSTFKNTVIYS